MYKIKARFISVQFSTVIEDEANLKTKRIKYDFKWLLLEEETKKIQNQHAVTDFGSSLLISYLIYRN